MTGSTEQPIGEQYVVGVDFGTLSGRALVVRVRDGEELGTAVHEYAHGVMDASPGGDRRARSHPSGRCRIRTTTATCCVTPCRRRSPRPASTPPT